MDLELLIRKNIRALKPYHSARQDYLSGILLDANENSFGSVIDLDNLSLNRYPDPYQREMRTILAGMNNVTFENIFVGVGSDEVIDLIVRVFCEPKVDSVLILEPTYGMYRVAASIQDIQVRSCLLTEDFQIDINTVKKSLDESTKLIFCCSPNNPTANLLHADDILELCKLEKIVVLDEAYIDFAKSKSLVNNIHKYPNLIVLRTLSKAWGLAGIRLGYCVADSVTISYLMKVKPPYNINALTSRTAIEALGRTEMALRNINAIIQQRKWLTDELLQLPCIKKVYPSDANFILVRCTDAPGLYKFLVTKDIIIRNRSSEPLLQNCLRITVGIQNENEILIQAIKEYCK